MSIPILEALKLARLEPGTVHATVNGYEVELKISSSQPIGNETGPPTLEPWAVLPLPGASALTTATPGEPFLPKPIDFDDSDCTPQ